MSSRAGAGARVWTIVACGACIATGVACGRIGDHPPASVSAGQVSPVFTPAHSTFVGAVNDFFWLKPRVEQPIEFPHKTHIEKGATCTEYCHESVTKGPIAGLPSVNACMVCHTMFATDRPLIKQITAMQEKGLDLQWERVYRYAPQAHVRFNHAPHIRAGVDCSTCHGDIAHQTVAQRNVDLHMGFCVSCHRAKRAPNECVTCHF
jgi:hypothetical protein